MLHFDTSNLFTVGKTFSLPHRFKFAQLPMNKKSGALKKGNK
jgi:hypothetical protein